MNIEPNDHVTDWLPAYALGILSDAECEAVESHLPSCQACREELAAYARVVEALPAGMVLHIPPADLKDKVMQRIHRTAQAAPQKAERTWWRRLKDAFRPATTAWGWVSFVLVLFLAFGNLFAWQRLSALERRVSADLITIALQGTEVTPQATGLLVVSRDGRHGTLVVDGLPALDAVHQYQLWLIRDGERDSGGVFAVDTEGYGSLWIEAPQPLLEYSAFGITIEPAGGSAGPTGDKVLGGERSG